MLKRIVTDPSALILLAGNAWCIYYFNAHPEQFGTVIWIYWFQSVIIGLFNFLDMITLKNFDTKDFKVNDQPATKENKGCTSFFFLFHYGAFHVAYLVFIAVAYTKTAELKIVMLGALAFLLESIITFRRKKIAEQTVTINFGTLFFLPYVRIVPMHLLILLPSFLHWQPSTIFLVLKTIADILFYFFTKRLYQRSVIT